MNSLTHDFRRLRHRHLTSQHNLQNTLCFCTCKREIFLFSLESIHNSILFFFHFLCSLLIKLFYSWVSRKWNKSINSIVYEKFIGNSSFSHSHPHSLTSATFEIIPERLVWAPHWKLWILKDYSYSVNCNWTGNSLIDSATKNK